MIYYVCNPLTKKWVSLPPPPPPRERNWVVTGFHCDDRSSSSVISTSYQVFRIPKFEPAKQFKVEIFSSDSGEWNTHQVSSPKDITWDYSSYNNVITHNGVLYWIQTQNRVLAYNFRNSSNGDSCGNQCRLIDLPDVESTENEPDHGDFYYSRQCLGVSEGMNCYGRITRMDMTLSIWVLDEEWKLLHKGEVPHDMLAEIESRLTGGYSSDTITQIQFLGFNPVDQNVVVLGPKNNIWSYNIRTQGYQQLCHPSFLATYRSSRNQMWHTFAFSLKPWPTILPPASWR
ncbi:F-box protein At3g26010-like [Papaver somniferum]|uniref:F-box protein At3g26010-like n=1 Tax=Papaver somniferum TaxID=3469 RepID=UPI000E704766|nr:F-box protein At3g26010-like [Papaver somniferum]